MDREVRGNRYCGSHVVELYNTERTHSSLGDITPEEFAALILARPTERVSLSTVDSNPERD
jgi:hypothetical protein